MRRHTLIPRNNWQNKVEKLGFGFHTTNVPYWDESACYEFTMEEILLIERATAELWDCCLGAVQYVMDNHLYHRFAIPPEVIPYIEKTWQEDHPAIYGRYDFCFKDGVPRLLEFNADTPTSLYEAGIVQWYWLRDYDDSKDQFNSIHEKLIESWKFLKNYFYPGPLHFACVKASLEDLTNTEYLRDCALQAGMQTKLVFIDDIGWDPDEQVFVDQQDEPIKNIFKLYPWEWMVTEEFGANILTDRNKSFWVEPAWKMILSNKAILPILWHLYPGCPWLLPAYFEPGHLTDYVKKPILSREGANIELICGTNTLAITPGAYGAEGYIYQQLATLPDFDGNHPVIGSWVIGQQSAGIGIRESSSLVTDNLSRFIPHYIC